MKDAPAVPSLMEELMAIRAGDCIWCQRGLAHPHYSRCKHKVEKVVPQVSFVGANDGAALPSLRAVS